MISCEKPEADDPTDQGNENNRPKNLEDYNATSDGLRDYFAEDGYFDIGVAIEPRVLDITEEVDLIIRHMNSLTAENAMKWSSIEPFEGSFNWTGADRIVDFASNNGMKVRGHTLCWHNQVPDWIFKDNGSTASKELVLERLRNHISAVVGRYKGKVYAWDVVNEAIADGGGYRNNTWYAICGKDYIFEAFRAAREADPAAKLFYNDYNATSPQKRGSIVKLLSELQEQDLVDGMGLQGHWNLDYPSDNNIKDAFNSYSALGIDLQITELDVSTGTADEYTTEIEQRQVNAYTRYFELFREYKENISSVTFWGLTDAHSWKNQPGSPDFPLLFNEDYSPKAPYFSIIDF